MVPANPSTGQSAGHKSVAPTTGGSRFLRALNLVPEAKEHTEEAGIEANPLSEGAAIFFPPEEAPVTDQSLVEGQKLFSLEGFDQQEIEELDSIDGGQSTVEAVSEEDGVSEEVVAADEADPDQLWFDGSVTKMFMDEAHKPQMETTRVPPRVETRAWPVAAMANQIAPVIAQAETSSPEWSDRPEEFAAEKVGEVKSVDVTSTDEKDGDAGQETVHVHAPPVYAPVVDLDEPVVAAWPTVELEAHEPTLLDDVAPPPVDISFAGMLNKELPISGGKRSQGVKLAPGWKPLRGEAGKALDQSMKKQESATEEEIAAKLRAPRHDSILDGFGQFLEETVVMNAALEGPAFMALDDDGFASDDAPVAKWAAKFSDSDVGAGSAFEERNETAAFSKEAQPVPSVQPPAVKSEWLEALSGNGNGDGDGDGSDCTGGVDDESDSDAELPDDFEALLSEGEDGKVDFLGASGSFWPEVTQHDQEDSDSDSDSDSEVEVEAGQNAPTSGCGDAVSEISCGAGLASQSLDEEAVGKVPDSVPSAKLVPNDQEQEPSENLREGGHRGFRPELLFGAAAEGSFFEDLQKVSKVDPTAEGDDITTGEVSTEPEHPATSLVAPATLPPAAVEVPADQFPPENAPAGAEEVEAEPEPEDLEMEADVEVESAQVEEVEVPWVVVPSALSTEVEESLDAIPEDESQEVPRSGSAEDSPEGAEGGDPTEGKMASAVENVLEQLKSQSGELAGLLRIPEKKQVSDTGISFGVAQINPMLLRHGLHCPCCGEGLYIQARYLGIEGKCPACEEMIVARNRMGVDAVAELADGSLPRFSKKPDIEPCDAPGGTVLASETDAPVDAEVPKSLDPSIADHDPDTGNTSVKLPPAMAAADEPMVKDPFSNPNRVLETMRAANAKSAAIWGPAASKGSL